MSQPPKQMNRQTLPMEPETANALFDALGAVVLCFSRQLNQDARCAMADDLARLARMAEHKGQTTLETMLIDLQRAARQ